MSDIKQRLQSLPTERAQWIAAFAMVLARAARADLDISSDEIRVMEEVVREYGELPPDQAALVVEMASHRNQLLGVTEDYLATREFNRVARDGDRERILHCLFAVCAADDTISVVEEEEVRQVASELGLAHEQYVSARAAFRDKRAVLRGMPKKSD
ncbi:MAG: TerB family tellurite resistance protein [Thermoanaerobaculales bacterium]